MWVCAGIWLSVSVVPSTVTDPAGVRFVNTVVNAAVPPDPAVPETTRSALLLCVVDLVQPVGAAVWAKSIAVPGAKGSTHDALVPSVVMNLPAFPDCPGSAVDSPVAATNAVVAICVVLVPTVAVGAVGVPVNVGLASGAKPAIDAPDGIVTVPVNVGDAMGALAAVSASNCVCIALVTPSTKFNSVCVGVTAPVTDGKVSRIFALTKRKWSSPWLLGSLAVGLVATNADI